MSHSSRHFVYGCTIAWVAGLCGLVGCGDGGGGSGADLGGTAGCFDYTSFDGMTPSVHFKADVLPILRQSCGLSTSCHADPNSPGAAQHYYGPSVAGPDPTAMQIQMIFDQSVGKSATQEPPMKVIAPGSPQTSFLLYKLDGDPTITNHSAQLTCSRLDCVTSGTCGTAMPSGGPVLPAATRDTLRRWIAQGAMND